jgi:hypothetical protein
MKNYMLARKNYAVLASSVTNRICRWQNNSGLYEKHNKYIRGIYGNQTMVKTIMCDNKF